MKERVQAKAQAPEKEQERAHYVLLQHNLF
jgi:hypothetical protein